jgi:hypothetical protein
VLQALSLNNLPFSSVYQGNPRHAPTQAIPRTAISSGNKLYKLVPRDTASKMFATFAASAPSTTYSMTLKPIRSAENANTMLVINATTPHANECAA